MNLRISANQLRIRVSGDEARQLGAGGSLHMQLRFSIYDILEVYVETWNLAIMKATFEDQVIRVCVPESMASEWAVSSAITMEAEQGEDEGSPLTILIEKDLKEVKMK